MTKVAKDTSAETVQRLALLVIKIFGLVAAVYIGVSGVRYFLNDVFGLDVPEKVFSYLFIAVVTATFGYAMQWYLRK